ncbi:uncharacterized protein LOC144617638 [Crassostrea virginica]
MDTTSPLDTIPPLEDHDIKRGCPRNSSFQEQLFSRVLMKKFLIKGIDTCDHMSLVSENRVWVTEDNNTILTDLATGAGFHRLTDVCVPMELCSKAVHSVNREGDLFYIDRDLNIKKLSKDLGRISTFVKKASSVWLPRSLYCSVRSGDLFVGFTITTTELHSNRFTYLFKYEGKVNRYNESGQLTQKLHHNFDESCLFSFPVDISENSNGDVVVSDFGKSAVVVTDRWGSHRFTYGGRFYDIDNSEDYNDFEKLLFGTMRYQFGWDLWPWGICTDQMFNILVCDVQNDSVHMLDKDGQFLLHLLTNQSPGINTPRNLIYDFKTQLLWVGSFDGTLAVYKYNQQHLTYPGNDVELIFSFKYR